MNPLFTTPIGDITIPPIMIVIMIVIVIVIEKREGL